MNSALYLGYVQHLRHGAQRHLFRYRTAYFYLDLAEIQQLNETLRLFGVDRYRLFSLWERDHLDGRGPLRQRLLAFLEKNALDPRLVSQCCLLTHVRQWHTVFNPVSFFYCFDSGGALSWVVAEVNNTFGERFHYVLPLQRRLSGTPLLEARTDKAMHVSPFTRRERARYEFRLRPPGERLTIAIRLVEENTPVLDAVVWANRFPLTDRQLFLLTLRHPWLTAKVLAAIHWQAFKLYLKGLPFFHQPAPSAAQQAQRSVWEQVSARSSHKLEEVER